MGTPGKASALQGHVPDPTHHDLGCTSARQKLCPEHPTERCHPALSGGREAVHQGVWGRDLGDRGALEASSCHPDLHLPILTRLVGTERLGNSWTGWVWGHLPPRAPSHT